MRVICIKESIYNQIRGIYIQHSMRLTLGETYDVIKRGPGLKGKGDSFNIINDDGLSSWYNREIVLPLEEWREMRLNEILNK